MLNIHCGVTLLLPLLPLLLLLLLLLMMLMLMFFDTHTNGAIAIIFVCVYEWNSLAVEQQRVGRDREKKTQKPNNFILYSVCRIFSYSLRLFIFVVFFFVFARFNFNTKRETFVLTYFLFLQTHIDVLFIQHQNWSGRGQSYSLFTVNDGI